MNGHADADAKPNPKAAETEGNDAHSSTDASSIRQADNSATGDKGASSSRKPATIDPHHGSDTTVSLHPD